MVIWLTGLSGAGKTTIGKSIFELWRKQVPNTVIIDRDTVWPIIGFEQSDRNYTLQGQRHVAERISDLRIWLDS